MSQKFEYPELKYVLVDPPVSWDMDWCLAHGIIPDHWGGKDFVGPCVRCGRYTEDPTKDWLGHPVPEHRFRSEEAKQPLCRHCRSQDFGEAFEASILGVFEEKLGLAEKHRDALREFIETIFTDPKKIVQLADLDNRVRTLERQNNIMWTVIAGLVIALLAVVVTLFVALAGGS